MSGGSSANNSWTILATEETVAETLRPLAEGTEHHEERHTSAAGSGPAETSLVEGHLVSEEQSEDTCTEQDTAVPTTVTDPSVPSSSEVSASVFSDKDALSQPKGLPEGPAESSPDPDSFSDSYTHITPSPDEPPASLLRTEILKGGEFRQEEEGLSEEGAVHLLNGEELQKERNGSDLSSDMTDLGKPSEFLEERTEETGEEGEPEVRRRSLLAALERIGRTEEQEEAEEDFELPRQKDDSGFSVNKCILGAVILLGLGTIFFSGFFMDLDEESEYGTRELKDPEVPGKQEWLNSDVPSSTVDADNSEILNKLAKGHQQILELQAQLQAQKEELKVARGQEEVEAKERLRWEELEKENSRLKMEMASLPVLQKENERMKRELESVPNLQRELETLRSTVTELKLSSAASGAEQESVKPTTLPPSGQAKDTRQGSTGTAEKEAKKVWDEHNMKDWKKNKYDVGEKKDWKRREEKSEGKDGEKMDRKYVDKTEWKMEKHKQAKSDKLKDKESKQKKYNDDTKQWRKAMASKGDEGKPWKTREGNKEWLEKGERKDLKKGKDWKKTQHEKVNDGKQWRNREEKVDWKGGNEERYGGREGWKGEKEWKKKKDSFNESGKEKWERKDWKEKGDKKDFQKNGKDQSKEGKVKGERKRWEEGESHDKSGKQRRGPDERKQWSENKSNSKNGKDDKEWKRKDERKQEKEERKRDGEDMHRALKKERSTFQKNKDEHHHDHSKEDVWGDSKLTHTHRRPSLQQPEYWEQQRDRLHRNSKPPQHCSSLETCAQAEGLLPVTLPEFEAVLQMYLAKAEEAGVEAFIREQLKKLVTEFFKNNVFIHDQMSFQDFVDDVSDILEGMVEGSKNEEEEEDSAIEEEMEEFEKEVIKKFSVPAVGEKEVRIKGERKKESGRGHG